MRRTGWRSSGRRGTRRSSRGETIFSRCAEPRPAWQLGRVARTDKILLCLCRREVERREVMQMQRLAFAHKHKQKLAKIARDAVEREEQLAVVKLETEAKMLAADRHRAEKRYVQIL